VSKSFPTLRTRCQIKTRYSGAALCCSRKATAVIRHEHGEVYRACTLHTRMAFDGLVKRNGETRTTPETRKLRLSGRIPPAHCPWKTIDPE